MCLNWLICISAGAFWWYIEKAIRKARKVPGITADNTGTVVKLEGDPAQIVDNLIAEYEALSGEAAVRFSMQAGESIIKENPKLVLPERLIPGYIAKKYSKT